MYLIKLEVRQSPSTMISQRPTYIVTADVLPQIYYALNRMNVETGAFSQLTRKYMTETFNPNTPDVEDVR
jgi:hypothetical protein